MSDPTKVTVVDQDGKAYDVDPSEVPALEAQGMRVEGGGAARIGRLAEEARQQHYGEGGWNKAAAVIAGGARTITGGMSDAGLASLGAGDDIAALREYNPGASLVGEIAGAFVPVGLPGLAARAGKTVGAVAEGASVGKRLLGAAKAGATEGAIFGAGSGVSELSLSKDPLSLERAISTIGSHALFGGAVGGAAGVAFKGAEIGLAKAKGALEEMGRASAVSDDLARLDAKGLRAAEKSELEAIEANRVMRRREAADEIKAYRQSLDDEKHFLTTDGVKLPRVQGQETLAAVALEAGKSSRTLKSLLGNPVGLAQKPERALDALQRQATAYEKILERADALKTQFAGNGERLAALEAMPKALERNKALQAKLGDLSAKPSSDRLTKILDAKDALSTAPKRGLMEEMLGGTIMGKVAGAMSGLPILGPMLGAKAGRLVTDVVFGKMANASAQVAERGAKAVGALLNVTQKVTPVAPVLASKTLASVRYGQSTDKPKPSKPDKSGGAPRIAKDYKARTDELKSQTMYDAAGKTVMRPEAREKIYNSLAAVRALDPIAADKMETIAARRVEFLAGKLPRKPDVFGLATGPDNWQPSDMEMRKMARYMAAVEDPIGVVERVATGQVTPEDGEAIREVYPEMFQDIQRQIAEQLPTLRASLPYQRRLALSIFSGMPVDPALHPRILGVLQRSYTEEQGSEGGSQAPLPAPAFGSVRNQEATPLEQHQGAMS